MKRMSIAVAVVLVVAGIAAWRVMSGDDADETRPLYTVQRGPLRISIIESGTLQPRERVVITNRVQGQSTIISLVEEGTDVTKGDLLIELDISRLEDQLLDQDIRVQNAEATFIRAREQLEVVRNQAKSDISRTELEHRFATEDLTRYGDGEYPNKLTEAESRIALANEEVERSAEKQRWSAVLHEERYISQTELQADALAAKRAQLDLQLAENARELLTSYNHPRRIDELESAIEQSAMALERVQRRTTADIVQAEADLRARQLELGRQRDRHAHITDQIAKARMTAPRDGSVIYATSARANWRGNVEPLAEGQTVRERQDLIYLPTADGMRAEMNVHEAQLGLISRGLPAFISVDALPNHSFTGRVAQVAPLPDATQMFMNPDRKVYLTQVHVDQLDPSLRAGMSCRIEVVVDELEDVLSIPVQAVVRHGRQAVVFVQDNSGAVVWRKVTIGLDNGSMVHVIDGLQEGTTVLLDPPLSAPDDLPVAPPAASPTAPAPPPSDETQPPEQDQTPSDPAEDDDQARGRGGHRRGEGAGRGEGGGEAR